MHKCHNADADAAPKLAALRMLVPLHHSRYVLVGLA